jgi:protein-S-isoprenylcysteine O-methyltransferase Ste14
VTAPTSAPAYGLWALATINSLVFIIFAGFILLARAWKVLYAAQQAGNLVATGPYAYVRHPQYVAFVLIVFGFLLQWPTIVTLAMLPAWCGCTCDSPVVKNRMRLPNSAMRMPATWKASLRFRPASEHERQAQGRRDDN